jgi:tetratricopeptide (TPR) repeat protein
VPGRDAQDREALGLDAGAYVCRGFEYLARPRPEDQDEAARLFGKALDLEPERPDALRGLARVDIYLYTLGLDTSRERLEDALEAAGRAVELAPQDAGTHAALALALAAADRLTPALEETRRAIAADAASAEAQASACVVLRLRRDLDGALEACRRAAAAAPNDPRLLTALGDTLRDMGRDKAAMGMYGQAVDLDHEAIAPQLGAAVALHKAGRHQSASGMFNLLLEKWDYAQDRVRLGAAALLLSMQRFDDALAMYEKVPVPEGGSLPTLLTLYGKAYCLQRLGRGAEAEYFLSGLIERVPRAYDGPARGRDVLFMAYGDLVGYFLERGRTHKVETLLRQAAGRPLAPTRFARDLAGRLESAGEAGKAAAVLETAILGADPEEDPIGLSDSALTMVRLRTAGGGRRLPAGGEAARALELAVERTSASPIGIAHYRLARALALAGQNDAAIASLAKARQGGYFPVDQVAGEKDFDRLRDLPSFKTLLAG